MRSSSASRSSTTGNGGTPQPARSRPSNTRSTAPPRPRVKQADRAKSGTHHSLHEARGGSDLRFILLGVEELRVLTPEQIRRYNEAGHLFPIDIFSPGEVAEIRAYIDDLLPRALAAGWDNYQVVNWAHALRWRLGHRDRQSHPRRRFGPAERHRGASAQPPVREAARRPQAGQLAPGRLLLAADAPRGRQHSFQESDRRESTCSTTSSAAVLILKARGSCRVPGWLGRLGRSDGSGRRRIVPTLPLRRMPADSISQLVAWRKRRPGRPSGAANTSASEA